MENEDTVRAGPEEKSLAITVHYSNQCGNAQNCLYPYSGTSGDPEGLKVLFSHDHTFIDFKDNYRCTDNFMQASVAVFDNDSDHSDDPKDWVDISDIPKLFPGVPCIISTSRHHMKQKGKKGPRPRFHAMFQINAIRSPAEYTAFLSRVQRLFPFFDKKALDAARFYFGNPDTEVYAFPGYRTLDEFIAELEESLAMETPEPWQAQMPSFPEWGSISEGGRNNTISHAAGKILKRWGDTPEAYEHFMETVDKCAPPLPDFEVHSTWKSARNFFHEKVEKQPGYIPAAEYNKLAEPKWEPPIPFTQHALPTFPVDAFPPAIRDYVLAVAETTQTPVDMAATASLAVLALCQQGKYQIKGKDDWIEPLNLFTVIVAEPSERKSAVISHMTGAVHRFEAEYNKQHSGAVERNRMEKRILEKKQRNLEEMVIKGKAQMEELQDITTQLADFREVAPLRLYVDDVTTEKLTSVLAENNGTAAVVSAEGGIFDMLAGIYTKNVNIDVFLKAHSGDDIRVDRIGRNSESIFHPALTVLLAVQPSVLSGMMSNGVFRGRGLTARFLYCMPQSRVGARKYRTQPIPEEVARRYEVVIQNLLQEETPKTPEIIQLSPEADALLEAFSNEVESKLKTEYADIPDWAGKLVGAVLRISGLLCRAANSHYSDFLDLAHSITVDEATMAGAIAIGRYFTEHARAAYSLMGADDLVKQSRYALDAILKNGLTEFTRRDIMRLCRSFTKAEQVQPVLNHLADLGYIALKETEPAFGKGRPTSPIYLVNPLLYQDAA